MRPTPENPTRRLLAPWATLAGLALAACYPGTDAATAPIETRVLARSLAPGEVARIVVTSATPLRRAAAEFLGRPVFLIRDASAAAPAGERWSGWAIIDLDQTPGEATVEVTAETTDGRQALGTLAVTIAPKQFPVEELTVSSRYVTPPPEVEQRLDRERAKLAAIYRSRSPLQTPVAPFLRPVPGDPTSIFGMRRVFNGEPRSPHPGLDLRADTGTEVRASGPGNVVLAQDLYYSGNTVILDHGGGLFTLYAHLSRIDVTEGDALAQGVVVGLSGATGRVTGPHLHWGAKIGDRPFDPAALTDPGLFDD